LNRKAILSNLKILVMNERQITILQSLTRTVDLCNLKSGDFTLLPSFSELVARLAELVSGIGQESQKLDVSVHGYIRAKNSSKDTLLQLQMPILRRIQAYAAIVQDELLLNEVKLNSSGLSRIHESMLGLSCRRILAICRDHAAELALYDLSPEMTDSLEAAIIDFESKLAGSPQYLGAQKAARQELEKLFDQALNLVKGKMDVLVEILKLSNPAIYTEYKNARKMESKARRSISLMGQILESGNLQPIIGATITIMKETNGDAAATPGTELSKTVKRSAGKGGFRVNSLAAGNYSITGSKEGYADCTQRVLISDTELNYIEIMLNRK